MLKMRSEYVWRPGPAGEARSPDFLAAIGEPTSKGRGGEVVEGFGRKGGKGKGVSEGSVRTSCIWRYL